jgi:hypothetical protein
LEPDRPLSAGTVRRARKGIRIGTLGCPESGSARRNPGTVERSPVYQYASPVASIGSEALALLTGAIATGVAVVALIVAIASAAFTRGQLLAAKRANQLSEHARSTALDIEQHNTVNFRGLPRPGHYSGAHPQNFISGAMEFDPETMSFESRLTILNMGPSNCFRLSVQITSSADDDFLISTTKPILKPGESLVFPINAPGVGLLPEWVLGVNWRDELGVEHERSAALDSDGYFVGARTNAR